MRRMLFAIAMAMIMCLVPVVSQADDTAPKKPAPAIYDTLANASTQIADALTLAKQSNCHVLIQWGANWCGWCRLLHKLLQDDPEVHAILNQEYIWVLADVGTKGKNADLLKKYGVDPKKGIPFLTGLNDSGQVIINQESGSLETADKEHPGHDKIKVIAFLVVNAPWRKSDRYHPGGP